MKKCVFHHRVCWLPSHSGPATVVEGVVDVSPKGTPLALSDRWLSDLSYWILGHFPKSASSRRGRQTWRQLGRPSRNTQKEGYLDLQKHMAPHPSLSLPPALSH